MKVNLWVQNDKFLFKPQKLNQNLFWGPGTEMRMPRGLMGGSMVFIIFLTIGLNGIVWSGLSGHVEGPKKVVNLCIYNCVLCTYLYFCICLLISGCEHVHVEGY